MTGSVRQVLYISRACEALDDGGIKRIVASAQLNNRRGDVSGVLALGPGLFAQVLEGDAQTIEQTLARIRADQRHHDVRLVLDRTLSARMFDRWSMELLVDDTSAGLASSVLESGEGADELLEHLQRQHAQDPLWWSPHLRTLALAA